MKNLSIITLCLIFPFIHLDSDSLAEMTKVYCSLKNPKEARFCFLENYIEKALDIFRKCVRPWSIQTLDEITEIFCNQMNAEESDEVKYCMDIQMRLYISIGENFLSKAERCMKNLEKRN